jgi:hypothetical protein
MHELSFDVEAAKGQLTRLFRDRVSAQGAVYNVLNVDLEDVDFTGIPQPIPNQAQLVADMKGDLQAAKTHGQRWFNDVQPMLTAAPQAAINYAALWNAEIPTVLAELQKVSPDRRVLQALFQGMQGRIDQQVQNLAGLMSALKSIRIDVAGDATNFSSNHAPFQQLENTDKASLTAARNTLAQLKMMIDQYNQEIEVDTIKAEQDIAIASNAMKYGGKLGKPGKIVGLTIGLIFIVAANMAIDDLLSAIDRRLADAQQAGEYELELTLLTAQLVSLETASSALASLVSELDDMIASLQQTIDGWNSEGAAIAAVVTGLQGDAPVNNIVSQFDLGKTQAEWDDLSAFATKWQSIEVSPAAANDLILTGPDSE